MEAARIKQSGGRSAVALHPISPDRYRFPGHIVLYFTSRSHTTQSHYFYI